MTNDYIYKKSLLENGIRVVSEKIPYVHSISIGIWILAGTIDESIENNGIAHFVEHMVFKGTKKRSSLELADSLEALGGHLNAFTGKELTCYYAHILDENIEIAVDVLSDLVLNPKLLINDIEKEKRVVIEEINELDDSPDELINEYFIESLFQPHSLSFATLGKKSTVNALDKKQILNFINKNYTGNRIVIAAAGNVDHKNIVDLVMKYLEKLPKYSKRKKELIPKEHFQKRYFENSFQQAHICIGRRSFSYTDPRRYAMLLMNTILGFGMSSRLFQNIREKYGLAYSIYSFSDFLEDTGIFGVYLGTDKDKIDLAIDLVIKEFKQFKSNKIEENDLSKRKNQLKGNLLLGLESTSNRMNRLARTEINYGDFYSIDSIITSIDKVTSNQISELAEWLFQDEKLTTIIFKPN